MFPIQQVQLPQVGQVPPPLMMDQSQPFAHYTFTDRWPAVIERVIKENTFTGATAARLRQLRQELEQGTVRSLQDTGAPDWRTWEQDISPYKGQAWLALPWLFAEFYFYRRILEAVDYFDTGGGADPFSPQKQAALKDAVSEAQAPVGEVAQNLYGALWGNRADLSLKPDTDWQQNSGSGLAEKVLVDHSAAVVAHLHRHGGTVDIVADNAGAELMADLALAASLLQSPRQVRLHLKAYPTFVSDATRQDFDQTLGAIADLPLASALAEPLDTGRLQVLEGGLWNRPLGFWQMSEALATTLAGSSLVILKGDANYRRLLGDCRWKPTESFGAIAAYFPTAVVALRTLKCELVVGMATEQIAQMEQVTPDWMTTGEWGLIQAQLD